MRKVWIVCWIAAVIAGSAAGYSVSGGASDIFGGAAVGFVLAIFAYFTW